IGAPVGNVPQPVPNLTAPVTSIAFGTATNTNVCYVAMNDGNIAMTTNITVAGGGFSLTNFQSAAGGELAQNMVLDPNDAQTLYVVTFTRVFVTNNGGTTWTNITDNLGALYTPGFITTGTFAQLGNLPQRGITLFNNGTATQADDAILVGGP